VEKARCQQSNLAKNGLIVAEEEAAHFPGPELMRWGMIRSACVCMLEEGGNTFAPYRPSHLALQKNCKKGDTRGD